MTARVTGGVADLTAMIAATGVVHGATIAAVAPQAQAADPIPAHPAPPAPQVVLRGVIDARHLLEIVPHPAVAPDAKIPERAVHRRGGRNPAAGSIVPVHLAMTAKTADQRKKWHR